LHYLPLASHKSEPPAWSRQLTDQPEYKPDIPPPRRNLR
jgi:hypothetical protein